MYFSDENLKIIQSEYQTVNGKYERLFMSYVARHFTNAKAREYATHGFPRRLKILVRCIDKVFDILPPDQIGVPTSDEINDAMIHIQAFVFNVFGSIDNLAWIWVHEKGLTQEDKTPIPNTWIGLGPKNKLIRDSFSKEFQEYLKSFDDWFDHMGNFRDALAHRIPLYIPPYVVTTDKQAAYRELEDRMTEAIKRKDFAEYSRLSVNQMKLAVFRPWMQHSFEEKATPIVFHAQVLADFNTIEELGRKMLEELNR